MAYTSSTFRVETSSLKSWEQWCRVVFLSSSTMQWSCAYCLCSTRYWGGWMREIKSHYGNFARLRVWTLLMRSRGAHTCIGGPYIVSSMRWMVNGSGSNKGSKKRALMYTPSRRTTYTVYRTHCWWEFKIWSCTLIDFFFIWLMLLLIIVLIYYADICFWGYPRTS